MNGALQLRLQQLSRRWQFDWQGLSVGALAVVTLRSIRPLLAAVATKQALKSPWAGVRRRGRAVGALGVVVPRHWLVTPALHCLPSCAVQASPFCCWLLKGFLLVWLLLDWLHRYNAQLRHAVPCFGLRRPACSTGDNRQEYSAHTHIMQHAASQVGQ